MNKELLIIINCNLYTIYKFVVTRMTTLLPILRKPVNSIKCHVIFILTFPKKIKKQMYCDQRWLYSAFLSILVNDVH